MKGYDFSKFQTDPKTRTVFSDAYEKHSSPIKILAELYKGKYFLLFKSVLFYIIQDSPVAVMPIITANIINIATYTDKYTMTDLWINTAIMAVFLIQNLFSTYIATKSRSLANRGIESGLRVALADKLQRLTLTFHKEMPAGRVQSKIMRDVENIEGLCSNLFVSCVSIVLNLTVSIVVTLSKSPIVFLFFIITVPSAVGLMFAFRKKLRDGNEAYRRDVEGASNAVLEMVELNPVTKAHALEKTAMSRFTEHVFKVANTGHLLDKINAIFGAASWVTFQIFQLVCLTFTGILAFNKVIQIGDIALYQSYFGSIIAQVSAVISLLPIMSKGLESVRSLGEIMWSPDVEKNEGKLVLDDVKGEFEFDDVTFRYYNSDSTVLNGLNLKVKAGETIALVGESGSGKSTIVNLAVGFYIADSGRVLLDGVDMREIDLRSYRSQIATVPQTSVLFSGTIRENITYGLENYTEEQLSNAVRVANLEEMLKKMPCGLDTTVGEHGGKLSGGQRQRVSIARAVMRNAKVIIFDEATSALDTVSEKLIQDSIEKLSKERTTFIVAHRLSTIRNADKIAVIRDGKCVEYGTWEELMEKKGEFYKFKSLQS